MRSSSRMPVSLSMVVAVVAGACGDSPNGLNSLSITISEVSPSVVQGDVVAFTATVRDGLTEVSTTVEWSVEPSHAGAIGSEGRFVAYEPGPVTVVAKAGGARAARAFSIEARAVPRGTLNVVGRGMISDRFTADLWVNGTTAYTTTWSTRTGPAGTFRGNRLYAWDVSNPAAPTLTDSVMVDAGTVNDVKIRDDGTLAALSHEGASDGQNGITLLDMSDPLHPTVIRRFTESMEEGVHNLWIDGEILYAAIDGSSPTAGLRVLDISDPANPTVISSFFGGNPAQNIGQFLHDVYVRDGLAFLSHWDAGLIILDVGNGAAGGSPQNPVEVGRLETGGGDTHNAWYWPAGAYVFVGEEDFQAPGIMHVVDVSDLSRPREVATFELPGTTPHNFWLDEANQILYLAWYDNGIWALDVSGELLGELDRQGRVVASMRYDGVGGCEAVVGTCSWAPQWHDGTLWVSDLNSGLWALRLDFP